MLLPPTILSARKGALQDTSGDEECYRNFQSARIILLPGKIYAAFSQAKHDCILALQGRAELKIMQALLILGTRSDPHISWVEQELRAMGAAKVFVLDFLETVFELRFNASGGFQAIIDGVPLPDMFMIWDRSIVVAGTPFYVPGNAPEEAASRAFVAEEWRVVYRLLCAMSTGGVINSLESRQYLAKPWQQKIAAAVGFNVPETIVTNDRSALASFEKAATGSIIMKSLSSAKIRTRPDSDVAHFNVMTMRISPTDIAEATDEEVKYSPHFVQHEIIKAYELRVVWVDHEMIGFRVDSQIFKSAEVDWRNSSDRLDFTRVEIDPHVQDMIGQFMAQMGLFTGSIDLIVDGEGRHWFLECNNQGAWGWLDEIVDGDVRRLFARKILARLQSGLQ